MLLRRRHPRARARQSADRRRQGRFRMRIHVLSAYLQSYVAQEDVKARITCLAVPVGQGARWRGQAAEEEEEAEDEEKEDAEEEDEDEDEEEDEEEEDEEPARKRQLKAKAER
eukprot:3935545-Rhodomonas_salina.8